MIMPGCEVWHFKQGVIAMKYIACFLIILASCTAIAEAAITKLVWALPTARTDGSLLPLAEIATVRVICVAKTPEPNTSSLRQTDIRTATTVLLSALNLAEGPSACSISIIDQVGNISERSKTVSVVKSGAIFSVPAPAGVTNIWVE